MLFASGALAQEPETRADALRLEREEKAKQLTPPEPSGLERVLLDLERGRFFERVLSPAEGLYPKIGTITAGSGFSAGPAYRTTGQFGGHADLSTFAAASIKRYWIIEGRMRLPRLLDERLAVDVYGRRFDYPEEPFFGIGPDSQRTNEVIYGFSNTVYGGAAALAPAKWFTVTGGSEYLTPRIRAFHRPNAIGTIFDDIAAPGQLEQPDYMLYEALADANTRDPRGNPRAGGRYRLAFQRYSDLDGGRYSFRRIETDVQQYIPFLNRRRVIGLRAMASASDPDDGARVPFYMQRTLGGPDDLRGFRRARFRDTHALLLQAEYRWEIFTALDGAVFYDAGKVASRIEDLNLRDLERDFGIGFRFGTQNGVFLRVEGAFGSSGGKHFIFRYGNVF